MQSGVARDAMRLTQRQSHPESLKLQKIQNIIQAKAAWPRINVSLYVCQFAYAGKHTNTYIIRKMYVISSFIRTDPQTYAELATYTGRKRIQQDKIYNV